MITNTSLAYESKDLPLVHSHLIDWGQEGTRHLKPCVEDIKLLFQGDTEEPTQDDMMIGQDLTTKENPSVK